VLTTRWLIDILDMSFRQLPFLEVTAWQFTGRDEHCCRWCPVRLCYHGPVDRERLTTPPALC
jgi:hypothetical protein